jgi:RNA polymerase sigma factor (sigma-70 family)
VPAERSFAEDFEALFAEDFGRVRRVLDRASGDPELASDLAQEAFVRLYRRGELPDAPRAWLITVALNLFRNVRTTRARRLRLVTDAQALRVHADVAASPADAAAADEERSRVRGALDRLSERERALLLLHAEGYSYRDLAAALELHEASVGTLLARARSAFRAVYGEHCHAP